jgi:hypothetical protein
MVLAAIGSKIAAMHPPHFHQEAKDLHEGEYLSSENGAAYLDAMLLPLEFVTCTCTTVRTHRRQRGPDHGIR